MIDDKLKEELLKWKEMNSYLKRLKVDEMSLRKKLVKQLLGDMKTGGVKFQQNGLKVSARTAVSLSIAVKGDEFMEIFETLDDADKACFNFNPSLDKIAYNKLEDRSDINQLLESKPAAPTLSVEEV